LFIQSHITLSHTTFSCIHALHQKEERATWHQKRAFHLYHALLFYWWRAFKYSENFRKTQLLLYRFMIRVLQTHNNFYSMLHKIHLSSTVNEKKKEKINHKNKTAINRTSRRRYWLNTLDWTGFYNNWLTICCGDRKRYKINTDILYGKLSLTITYKFLVKLRIQSIPVFAFIEILLSYNLLFYDNIWLHKALSIMYLKRYVHI